KALALARNQNKPQARKIRLEPVIDVESDFLLRSLRTAGDPHQVLTFNGKEPSQFPRARILSTRLNAIEFYRSGDLNMIRPERPVIRRVLLRLCRNQIQPHKQWPNQPAQPLKATRTTRTHAPVDHGDRNAHRLRSKEKIGPQLAFRQHDEI